MSDLNFQDFSTVQSDKQPLPKTIAAAATITPTGFLTFLTGATQVATITPPVSGAHMLVLVFATGQTLLTTGNIKTARVVPVDMPIVFVYDPSTAKYWVGAIS